jgi:hypothetical protein
MELEGRWRDLDYLLNRQGNVVGPGFEPGPEIREFLQNDCRCARDRAAMLKAGCLTAAGVVDSALLAQSHPPIAASLHQGPAAAAGGVAPPARRHCRCRPGWLCLSPPLGPPFSPSWHTPPAPSQPPNVPSALNPC